MGNIKPNVSNKIQFIKFSFPLFFDKHQHSGIKNPFYLKGPNLQLTLAKSSIKSWKKIAFQKKFFHESLSYHKK